MTRARTGLLMSAITTVVLIGRATAADLAALAARIDARVETRLQADGVEAAPVAGDVEFLRRVYLDLTGRIPRPADVHAFLADKGADRRRRLIDNLLEDP